MPASRMTGMVNIGHGFECEGTWCYPVAGTEQAHHYLPLGADSQRAGDGRALGQVIVAGNSGFLQIATVWDICAARLETLRREVAARTGVQEPALVRLSFAPVTVDEVLLLAPEQAGERRLATARSSGISPHAALFSMALSAADLGRAQAAFNGRTGFLQVRYHARLRAPVRHVARLSGDLAGVRDDNELAAALAQGRARLEIDAADLALREAFIARAAQVLALLGPDRTPGDTSLAIELMREEELAVQAGADVGAWFADRAPGVLPVPGPGFGTGPAPADGLTVSLALAGAQEVVASVEVASDGSRARLDAPAFAPVRVPRPATGAPIGVQTRYAGIDNGFETSLAAPAAGALALAPQDLGLIAVMLDAGPLVEKGLDRARTTLRYRPRGPGERDQRTFHLERPPFTARWWLVARGEPLGESLSYDLTATLASGERLRHGPVTAHNPTITLGVNIGE